MIDFAIECMKIALKGSLGMIFIMAIILLALLVLFGAAEFFKVLFTSPPDPGEPTNDKGLEEDKDLKIIDGGKE